MKKRVIALFMVLAFVMSMTAVSFASEQKGDLSGLMDMISGIADSAGESSGNQSEPAQGKTDTSDVISGLADLFSGIADSSGKEGSGQTGSSDLISGLSDLLSAFGGSDTIDESVIEESAIEEDTTGSAGKDTLIAGISEADTDMEYDTLGDWDIKVPVPDGALAVLDSDGCYYLYVTGEESIPYVMVTAYEGFADEEEFLESFTDYMTGIYSDLVIAYGPQYVTLGGRDYYGVEYEYTIQGYTAEDTRLCTCVGDRVYMFAAKEISELDMLVGDALQQVINGAIFLGEDTVPVEVEEPQELAENELTWDMVSAEVEESGVEGDFVTFSEVGLKMWLPDMMTLGTLPDEQPGADTFLGYFVTPNEDAYASVQFVPTSMTLEEYGGLLESLGDQIEIDGGYLINGIPAIVYFIPENESMCVSMVKDGEGLVEFAFAPTGDEFLGALVEIMAISIQEAE